VISGDSLEYPEYTPDYENRATTLNDPSGEMLRVFAYDPLKHLAKDVSSEQEHIADRMRYLKLQIMGDLTLGDVKRIQMPNPRVS
jgi:hypothetical protein